MTMAVFIVVRLVLCLGYVFLCYGFWVCAEVCCVSSVVECSSFLESKS